MPEISAEIYSIFEHKIIYQILHVKYFVKIKISFVLKFRKNKTKIMVLLMRSGRRRKTNGTNPTKPEPITKTERYYSLIFFFII